MNGSERVEHERAEATGGERVARQRVDAVGERGDDRRAARPGDAPAEPPRAEHPERERADDDDRARQTRWRRAASVPSTENTPSCAGAGVDDPRSV